MKFLRLLAMIVFVPIISFAQSNYKKGYIIKLNGDTVKGEINYREWHTSPKAIQFKQDGLTNQPYEINAISVRGLGITGYEKLISYVGPVSTAAVSYLNLANHLDTTMRMDTTFLSVVYEGNHVALLSHTDVVKTRFFVMENNKFQELKYYQHFNIDGTQVVTEDTYKRQLIALLAKYNANYTPASVNEIQQVAYSAKGITRAMKLINQGTPVRDDAVKNLSKVRFFASIAAASTLYKFDGPEEFGYQNARSCISPMIGVGVDFLKNEYIQNYFFRFEVSVLRNSPRFNGTYSYYTYTETRTAITPQIVWNVYNTPKLQYFLNVGIGLNYSFLSNNKLVATEERRVATPFTLWGPYDSRGIGTPTIIKEPYNIRSGMVSIPLKTGFVFNRRAEVFVMYRPLFSGAAKGVTADTRSILAAGTSYFFGKSNK